MTAIYGNAPYGAGDYSVGDVCDATGSMPLTANLSANATMIINSATGSMPIEVDIPSSPASVLYDGHGGNISIVISNFGANSAWVTSQPIWVPSELCRG